MTDHRKTAVYIRLSEEDDNVDGRAKKESDSVTSQRILLKSFVIDQLGVAEADILEYVDDGVSGTYFKRQGFQQLQDDMRSGEIGCVVVKDFSRFGRDYLEVGFYIEYIFPLLQIRFISINDSYDSAASSGMTGGMNVALQNLVYNIYSLDLSKKISSAMQTRTKNGTRLPVNARYGYKKGEDGRLEVDPEAAKVVKMIFRMAAEGTSFADITRELNGQAIATCDEQKLSRGDQVQFQRFETIKKKHWSPTTVAAIVRDEIYIGTRIWGKTRCSMHTGHKAVLNDETEWVRLENHHTAIIDRQLFEKANEMHPKKKRSVAESRTNFTLERCKKQPALLLCAAAMCQLWAFFTKRNGASAKMLRCSNQWRFCVSKSGDPTGTAGGEYPWACSSVCSVNIGKRKESIFQQAMRRQRDQYRRIAKTKPTVDLGKDETL